MQGVILAAGRGSRLGALTLTRSKAMLPVLGRPLVRRVLDSLAPLPIDEWIIVAGPSDMELAGYFQREHPDIPVRLVYQPEPIGMAAALRCAAPLIGGDFALSACDNLATEVDIQHMLARWQAAPHPAALLALLRMPLDEIGRSAAVLLQGERVTRIVEKPAPGEAPGDVASLPLFLFTLALLEHLEEVRPSPRGEYELQDAIAGLVAGGAEVDGILFSSRQTLTSPADLLALNLNLLASGMEEFPVLPSSLGTGTRLVPLVCIEPETCIGSHCVIGPQVYLERGCQVGDGVQLERAVVLRGAVVPSRAVYRDQVVS